MPLTSDQYLRYARHLTLPEFGEAGQERSQEHVEKRRVQEIHFCRWGR